MTGVSALYPDGAVFVLWLLHQQLYQIMSVTLPNLAKLFYVWEFYQSKPTTDLLIYLLTYLFITMDIFHAMVI